MGAFCFCAQCRGIRTRQGAELRKREAFSSAAREGRQARSGTRAAKWTLGEYQCAKNAKYEYCYLFGSSVFEVIKGKSDIRTTVDSPDKQIY